MPRGEAEKIAGINRKATDRISELHSDLKHLILEHLPLEQIARATSLSTQWRRVFRDHPNLIFDEEFFAYKFKPERNTITVQSTQEFINWILSIMLAHSATIDKFTMCVPVLPCPPIEDMSTTFALIHDVIRSLPARLSQLHIDCRADSPLYIFKESRLLELQHCSLNSHPILTSFTQLTQLHLYSVILPPDFIQPLSRVAPKVKCLSLRSCTISSMLTIDVPSLTEFVMEYCDFDVCMFTEAASSLSSIVLRLLPKRENLAGFHRVLPKLTRLELLIFGRIQTISPWLNPQKFSNDALWGLRTLILDRIFLTKHSWFMRDLILFLKRAKNVEELQILTHRVYPGRAVSRDSDFADVLENNKFTFDRLRALSFVFRQIPCDNYFLLRFLLACCPALVNLNISYDGDTRLLPSEQEVLEERISEFRRASLIVKVNILPVSQ